MANGNLTKKEPKIVENDHNSLKKPKIIKKGYKLSKIAINGRKGQTIVENGKNKNWILKKLEKTQQTGNSRYGRGFAIFPRPLAEISTTTKSKTI